MAEDPGTVLCDQEPDSDCDTDQVNQDLVKLLAGKAVPVSAIDFSRKDAMQYVPKTKVNTGYIVMVLLFNERGQLLMVQEAKASCRGEWYLPAGRLERGETLVEGAKREVKEEAGLDCDLSTLLSVHFDGVRWIRFSFFGKVTGGKLKTLDQKDSESLQALFFDVSTVLKGQLELRSRDILTAIRQALEYKESLQTSVPLHPVLLPGLVSHSLMLHRFVLVVDLGVEKGLMMLVSRKGTTVPHVCTCAISPKDPILLITVHAIIRTALQEETFVPTIHGTLSLEHNGAEEGKDGICLTTLVSLALPLGQGLPGVREKTFQWIPVTDLECVNVIRSGINGHLVKLKERS